MPVLLRKGSTKLALYGMANVRDERLYRTFRDQHVVFSRPTEDTDEWFNLMAVHQNHVPHTSTSYLPETFLPKFLDFVVWGHEHDCIMNAIRNPVTGVPILQPGSSVATSLIDGESIPKHVAILSIKNKEFKLEPIPLMTVRPFAIESVSLAADSDISPSSANKQEITKWLIEKVEALIVKAIDDWRERTGNNTIDQDPPLPLVRLKVDYSGGYEVENPRRFSNRFVSRVANANDVITFHRRRATNNSGSEIRNGSINQRSAADNVTLDHIKVQSLVEEFLQDNNLQLLPENGLGDAVQVFVEKDEKDAVKTFVDNSLGIQLDALMKVDNIDEEVLPTEIVKTKSILEQECKKRNLTKSIIEPKTKSRASARGNSNEGGNNNNDEMMVDETPSRSTTTTRGRGSRARGRGRGRGTSKASTTTTRKSQRTNISPSIIEDEESSNDDPEIIMSDEDDDVYSSKRKTKTTKPSSTRKLSRGKQVQRSSRNSPDNSFEELEEEDDGDDDDILESVAIPTKRAKAPVIASMPARNVRASRNSTNTATVITSPAVPARGKLANSTIRFTEQTPSSLASKRKRADANLNASSKLRKTAIQRSRLQTTSDTQVNDDFLLDDDDGFA